MKRIIFIVVLFFGCVPILAQKPSWVAKIKTLQKFPATEKDVNFMFNDPKIISESRSKPETKRLTKSVEYAIPEGVLSVFYSQGRCSEGNTEGYDLDDGVIISFYLSLKPSIEISKTGLDIRKLDWAPDVHSMHRYYIDRRRQLRYTVLNDSLQAISFSGPDKLVRPCSKKIEDR
jgi:hypothetical protein